MKLLCLMFDLWKGETEKEKEGIFNIQETTRYNRHRTVQPRTTPYTSTTYLGYERAKFAIGRSLLQ
jgi:acyl-CoA-binding protein